MTHETKDMLVEVTSNTSMGACKTVMDAAIHEFLLLGIGDVTPSEYHTLVVQQVRSFKICYIKQSLRSTSITKEKYICFQNKMEIYFSNYM